MPMETKKAFPDPLVRDRTFPEPASIFSFAPVPLRDALQSGIVVVDTNVLLVPYTTSKASLEQIRRTYEQLVNEGRLRIPGQVAREFADQRAEKLKLLFQQLSRKRNFSVEPSQYPLLEDIQAYSELKICEEQISSKVSEYRKLISSLLENVETWQWNDPVSNIYRELFKPPVFVEPEFNREDLLEELKYRQDHRIPPGYKDASNEHSGVGDLLIWKTLLHIGSKDSRHVVFVSGDEKSDWRYQSENQHLYPRYELLDEFRRHSNNKSLLIISFAELLEQLGVPAPVVAEVKQEETVSSATESGAAAPASKARLAKLSVLQWLERQHPDRNVYEGNYGSADVVVDNLRGYDVKFIRNTNHVARRIREFLNEYPSISRRWLPTSIVIVVDNLDIADAVDAVVLKAIQSGGQDGFEGAQAELLLGYVTLDGFFVLHSRRPIQK